ncbi:(2Fe-2S)-binding protein [Dysosmobacter sp.]|uniref:(2Fe-2S)-binding protein n=1 Tax=Dysosmobacter sp. TaxID=2591382 RepID=UPI002D7F6B40|nr:(2Fe-2S)-binding protein [Dysosmobacter sp.]
MPGGFPRQRWISSRFSGILKLRDRPECWKGDDVLNRKKEACHCRNVTYGMIEDAVRNGAETVQQVMDVTGAGKGCGKCRDFLGYLIRDIQEELKK